LDTRRLWPYLGRIHPDKNRPDVCATRDGQAFLVRPAAPSGSPLDVPGIDAGLSRKEILDLVRESRRSTGRLLRKSRAPHKSPHRGKRSPSRQGSALNPA